MGREAAYFLHLKQEMATYCHLLQLSAKNWEFPSVQYKSWQKYTWKPRIAVQFLLPNKKHPSYTHPKKRCNENRVSLRWQGVRVRNQPAHVRVSDSPTCSGLFLILKYATRARPGLSRLKRDVAPIPNGPMKILHYCSVCHRMGANLSHKSTNESV